MTPRRSDTSTPPSRLARESAVVGAATLLSRLLGFARDVLIARALGAGPVADAFLAALRLPNLVRRVLGEGGLNAPFVPLYLEIRATQGTEAAQRFAGQTTAHLGLLLLVLVALGELFAPWLVLGLAGGFAGEPETLALAAQYTRLMLPFLLLTTLASLLAALLNAQRRFAFAALAPASMNLILLGVLTALVWQGAAPAVSAGLLAACISATGLVHLCLIASSLRAVGLPRPSLHWSPAMRQLVRTGGATLLAASAAQLVLLLATQIASTEAGSVAALYYADRLFQLPLGFVGVAMGTVALSDMASATTQAEHDATLGRALGLGIAMAVPAAMALFVLADPIVSVLFEHGRFGAQDRERTAAALAGFAFGLPFAVIAKVFGQVYFARQAPRTPLIAGFAAVLAVGLTGFLLAGRFVAAELAALAASTAFLVQALWLAVAVTRDGYWRPRRAVLRPVLVVMAASAAMLAVLLLLWPVVAPLLAVDRSVLSRGAGLAMLCGAGLLVYGLTAWLGGALGASPGKLRRGALLRLGRASARRPRR